MNSIVSNDTDGVVIETLCPNRTDNVVAAPPMEILPISPRASFSISVSSTPVTAETDASSAATLPASAASATGASGAGASAAGASAAGSSAAGASPPPRFPFSSASISSCEIKSSLISIFISFRGYACNLYRRSLP